MSNTYFEQLQLSPLLLKMQINNETTNEKDIPVFNE